MTKEEMTMLLNMFDERLDKKLDEKLEPIKKDIKHIKKQVDILYDWTDGIDLDVRNLKKVK